ncbi:hypothetical protein A3Q40_03357 [Rhodococcus sp. PBTS 1]|nr:hypothetical protein A3Q40_03357 [Rhodococcus sp. PBTS 1]
MRTGDRPPQRGLWSKHAWKTVREAMWSTTATCRLAFIICTFCVVPAAALLLSAWAFRVVLF